MLICKRGLQITNKNEIINSTIVGENPVLKNIVKL